jgi:hypothetical protein
MTFQDGAHGLFTTEEVWFCKKVYKSWQNVDKERYRKKKKFFWDQGGFLIVCWCYLDIIYVYHGGRSETKTKIKRDLSSTHYEILLVLGSSEDSTMGREVWGWVTLGNYRWCTQFYCLSNRKRMGVPSKFWEIHVTEDKKGCYFSNKDWNTK